MGRWIRIAAALAAVGAAGCAGFGRTLETPRVSLASLQVREARGLETVFLVQVRVTNPNEVDLDVRGVECQLDINDKEFAFGISDARVRIPAMGSETIPVTVYSSVLDIVRGLLGLPQREGPALSPERQGAPGGDRMDAVRAAVRLAGIGVAEGPRRRATGAVLNRCRKDSGAPGLDPGSRVV